jgi:hypothetical protein
MDYNSFCQEILNLNSKVRYAGVYNTAIGDVYEKSAKEIERLFTEEQTKKSLVQAYMRWKTRESFSDISGKPIFTMTKYEKINRMTMPCGKNAILMVSMQSELDPQQLINDILSLVEKYADNENSQTLNHQLNF